MQQIKFNYSLKNIGLTSEDEYRRNIINKTQSVIQRMLWEAHFSLNQTNTVIQQDKTTTYGLKSKLNAPPVAELKPFEDDVAKLIENIKFTTSQRICEQTFVNQRRNSTGIPNKNRKSFICFDIVDFYRQLPNLYLMKLSTGETVHRNH